MNAQCIMVCSGKGGTGKSTVSVLLGACLARLGRKTLLVELDSGLRSVDIIAGVYGRTVYDIEDVLCGRCEGAKAVVPSPLYPGLSVISAPYEGGAVEAAPLGRLLTAMRPYFDFILLDTAAAWARRSRHAAGKRTVFQARSRLYNLFNDRRINFHRWNIGYLQCQSHRKKEENR